MDNKIIDQAKQERLGVKAIQALLAASDSVEPVERTRANWKKMSEHERQQTFLAYNAIIGKPLTDPAVSIPEKYKDTKFKLTAYGETYEAVMAASNYDNNGRLRIDLMDADTGEPCLTLTMNLTNNDPGDDGFFVKTYSENMPLISQLLESGVFIVVEGHADPVWKFAP